MNRNLSLTITAIFFCIGAASAQNQRHVITPADVLTIRELSDVKLSPNGKQIVFVVNEPNDPKSPREPRVSNIWVVPADGRELPRALIPGLKSAGSPRWSPGGGTLAFLSDQEIYLLRDGETKPSRLTNVSGGVEDYEWSPDGKMIAYVARDQATSEEQARRAAGDDAIVRPESNFKYTRLWVVNLSDRKATQVTKQNFEILELAWSPAGDELALTVAPTPRDEDSYNASLVVVSRATGEVLRTLTRNVPPITGLLRWSPDGRWITFYEFPPTKESNNWLSLAPASGGEIRPLLKDYKGSVLKLEWAADSKSLIALSVEGTSEVITRIDIDTGALHKITDVVRSQWGASLSTNGETIAYVITSRSIHTVWTYRSACWRGLISI